uniref:Ankyrin repeat protein n=1 Tax=viral metagenome TaxID=1070528 RepID=A0A6C0AFS7_9ZZZZ
MLSFLKQEKYKWLKKSKLYENFSEEEEDEDDEKTILIHCAPDEKNMYLLFKVIKFWDVYEFPELFYENIYNLKPIDFLRDPDIHLKELFNFLFSFITIDNNNLSDLCCKYNYFNALMFSEKKFPNKDYNDTIKNVNTCFIYGSFECFIYFFEEFVFDQKDYIYFFKTACHYNHLNILKVLEEKIKIKDLKIKNANYKILKFLFEKNITFDIQNFNLKIIKFYNENNLFLPSRILSDSLISGDLESFKYALKNGCQWNNEVDDKRPIKNILCLEYLKNKNQLDILDKYLIIERNIENIEVLVFIIENFNVYITTYQDWIYYFINNNYFEMYKYCIDLHEDNISLILTKAHIKKISEKGRIEFLEYISDIYNFRYFLFDKSFLKLACESDNLETVMFFCKKGFRFSEECVNIASRSLNLEILKYLYENNCPWDREIIKYLISDCNEKSYQCLKFCNQKGLIIRIQDLEYLSDSIEKDYYWYFYRYIQSNSL